MQNNWQLPEVFIAQYLAACKLASIDDKAFANFRNDPHIQCVIENTNKDWANRAMEKMGYTPTMVRYMYIIHLLDLLMPEWDAYIDTHIIEIGAGYGGLAKIIRQLKGADYTIYDLPEVIELQKRFLDYLSNPITFRSSITDQAVFEGETLCISWCAWSELSYDLRVEYAEKVISKCDHFFICANYNKEEDLSILSKYFSNIKEYSDELVSNVIYV